MSTQGHEQEAVNVQDLKAAFQKFKTDKIDNGEAPGFVAGNVVGEFSDTGAEFAYRPTAGAVDIESGIADHGGHLEVIKGNTVAWNQLLPELSTTNYHFVNATENITQGVISMTATAQYGGVENYTYNNATRLYITGHKYIVLCEIKTTSNNIKAGALNVAGSGMPGATAYPVGGGNWEKLSMYFTAPSYEVLINYHAFSVLDMRSSDWDEVQVRNVQCFDLTLIYGAGNEPTTVEQFEADYQKWFGKPLTYEEYDAGSLRPMKMTGLKTVGFNQWDEEWEVGNIDSATGQPFAASGRIRSKNFCSCLGNASYHVNNMITSVFFYDKSQRFIKEEYTQNLEKNITTPENASYFKIISSSTYGEQYNHDICINLRHSGDRDGDYEPYWESQLNVPITTLKGKLNGEDSSVVIFPDGMKKAGSVYDEIVRRGDKTYAIKRVGSVDLGTLTWNENWKWTDYRCIMSGSLIGVIKPSTDDPDGTENYKCAQYIAVRPTSWTTNDHIIISWFDGSVELYNRDYSDSSALISSLSGVMYYYELATPEEYLLDDFELPQDYDVDDYGTEEILLGTNGCAPILDLKYGINAGDTIKNLPHNYVSAIGEQNFTEAQKARARKNIGLEKGEANGVATLDENGHVKPEQVNENYPDLIAGNIVGDFSDNGAEFAYRPSAGAVDIESGKVDHGGHLQKVKGNTVPWNQEVNINWGGNQGQVETSINDGIINVTNINTEPGDDFYLYTFRIIAGHKYYFSVEQNTPYIESTGHTNWDILLFCGNNYYRLWATQANTWQKLSILSPVNNTLWNFVRLYNTKPGTTVMYRNPMIIDLTLIYGAGNEPTTVEQFEADYQKWFGKPLTYEGYDKGSLRPVKMAGIKTVGFNLWDEEKEAGTINAQTGQPAAGSDNFRSKNYIPVIPNTIYCILSNIKGISSSLEVMCYDKEYNYVGYVSFGAIEQHPTLLLTTPSNTAFIKFSFWGYGSNWGVNVPNYDICLNLHHSGDRDGEYEPHWESQLNVPITTLTGKLNGEGTSVTVFPDGMKKTGSVYDEIVRRGDKTYAIKRVGSVDLGTQIFDNTYGAFQTPVVGKKESSLNLICPKYITSKSRDGAAVASGKISIGASDSNYIFIGDSNYSDAATFQTAMSGVYLFYELATPEEYLLDDFELPQDYDVDDWGTEEILLGENGCAPILDLKYGINAGDTIKNLPHNYVSAVSEQAFTPAQQARARMNIGAIEKTMLDALTRHTRLTDFDLNVLKQAVADQNLEKYGLKVGDQKTINGHDYVIAGLNCMRGPNNRTCTTDHVGLIVLPHTTQAWNASGSTTQGADNRGAGYINSDLHYYLKNTLLPLVNTDLGADNLLGHTKVLSSNITDGKSSSWATEADCKICALSEVQVYSSRIWGSSSYDIGEANQQLEVFQHFKHTEIFGNEYPWLRDVVSATSAANASREGYADYNSASTVCHVAALILFH